MPEVKSFFSECCLNTSGRICSHQKQCSRFISILDRLQKRCAIIYSAGESSGTFKT